MIFRARAPRMVSRLGRLRQLSNGFGVFPLSRTYVPVLRGTAQVQETARAREYAATSPLSRVPFLSQASTILPLLPPETTRVYVFASFCVTAYRTVYRVRREPSPSLVPLPSIYLLCVRVVSNCRHHLASDGFPVHRD